MHKWLVRWGSLVSIAAVILGCGGAVYADTVQQSPNYQFEYSDVGGGGLNISSSSHYQSVLSTQDAAVGSSSSNNYQGQGGSQTTGDPALSLTIDNSGSNFTPLFSSTAVSTASSSFSVIDYTSYGYDVLIVGTPPTNEGHTIPGMNNGSGGATTSSPGTEQFGINLVKNANFLGAGQDLGADPDRGQFGASAADAGPTTNYNTPGKFYYSNGDTIVHSAKSSGQITYTISYIINVAPLTPGGRYSSNLSLICIATY